jgi:hypothetical protein
VTSVSALKLLKTFPFRLVIDWNAIFQAQMLTYLRLTELRLGWLINFGERIVTAGIHQVVNGLPEDLSL